jgi:hypothetical protein
MRYEFSTSSALGPRPGRWRAWPRHLGLIRAMRLAMGEMLATAPYPAPSRRGQSIRNPGEISTSVSRYSWAHRLRGHSCTALTFGGSWRVDAENADRILPPPHAPSAALLVRSTWGASGAVPLPDNSTRPSRGSKRGWQPGRRLADMTAPLQGDCPAKRPARLGCSIRHSLP